MLYFTRVGGEGGEMIRGGGYKSRNRGGGDENVVKSGQSGWGNENFMQDGEERMERRECCGWWRRECNKRATPGSSQETVDIGGGG